MSAPSSHNPSSGPGLDKLHKLRSIFLAQKWNMEEKNNDDVPIFERFVEMIGQLNEVQSDLIMDLTERFRRIEFDQYFFKLALLVDFVINGLGTANEILLVAPKSNRASANGQVKSGDALLYPAMSTFKSRGIRCQAFNSYSGSFSRELQKANTLVMPIDDFVGTGDTAIKFASQLQAEFGVAADKIVFAALISLAQGANRIRECGYKFFCTEEVTRGISDREDWSDQQRAEKRGIMKSIEDRMSLNDEYRFGYKKSEALVKMIRTPNNTFPLFWSLGPNKASPWPAPFPR